jgi:hypothetical protein
MTGLSNGRITFGWASKIDLSSVVPDLGLPMMKKNGTF